MNLTVQTNPGRSIIVHVVVENQLASNVEPVPETIAKLTRQGLDRHEAIHAIGAALSEDVFDLLRDNSQEFSLQKYSRKLKKLSAKRWSKVNTRVRRVPLT